jgi:hypothetical protein
MNSPEYVVFSEFSELKPLQDYIKTEIYDKTYRFGGNVEKGVEK